MQVEVESDKWCSWCFEQGTHYLIEPKLLERNTYRCAYCCNDTKCCTICADGMSRSTTDGADKLCMKCDGTIENWGIYPSFVEQQGHCSWCFKDTTHLLVKYNYVRRSIYMCSECKHRTLRCRTCDKDFARGSVSYDDESCYVCNDHVPSWDHPENNNKLLTKTGWCSWCITEGSHVMESVNTMRRDAFNCSACEGRTLPCFTCKIGMARGGGSWDSDCCLVCSQKKNVFQKVGHGLFSRSKAQSESNPDLLNAWQELAQKKADVSAKYNDPDYVRSELKRDSPFRKQAFEAGMIRPFLLLVGMTPELRNQVSNFLGWSIFTENCFGDSHAESWDILNRSRQGIISRGNSVNQKLNPLADDGTYFQTIHRVISAIFKFNPIPELSYEEAFQASTVSGQQHSRTCTTSENKPVFLDTERNTLTSSKEAALNAADHITPGEKREKKNEQGEKTEHEEKKEEEIHNEKNTLAVAQLEEFLMGQVHSQQRKTMTKAQRENEDKLVEEENGAFKTAVSLMRMKAGLSNKQAIQYGVGVARQMFQVPGKWGLTLMSMQALQTALPATAVFMGPAIAGLSVLMGPLAVIGLAKLVWSGVNLAVGPTLWSLYGPLVLMCNQRIVLALQDMPVENFY